MNKKLIRIIAAAVLLLAAWLITRATALPVAAQLVIFLVPYLLVGYDVLAEAAEGIMEGDPFDEDFLMAIATIGALLIGFLPGAEPQFTEAVFVMLFFQVGELFEDYAEDKSRDSIAELMDIRPDTARVLRGSEETVVSPDTVAVGETVIVRPGEKIPLDGIITEGDTSLNTIALTGESMPRSAHPGDEVISGCVNVSGLIKVRTAKTFSESTASKIIKLVEDSSANKSRSETFIRKFSRVYTPIVVFLAIALAVIPPFFAASYATAFPVWLYRALTFLVVSCPCALVMSVPLTFFGGIGGASRQGILIKGGNYMDTLAKAQTVVFDKTGTLTRGVFAVTAVHPHDISEQELLHLAAHVERHSSHPIAAALRDAYPNEHDDCAIEAVEELAGRGIRATVNGRQVCVGNEKMMAEAGAEVHACERCRDLEGTVIHVAVDGVYSGHIVISDQVKADSREAIAKLKQLGVGKAVMLTGDREQVGQTVARQLDIDELHAGLLPAEKVTHVERLLAENEPGRSLVFVGDGINDAPVLARADVGIAMGGLGSDAAIEAADVVLMDDKPSKVALAIALARRTIGIARQNVAFAITVKAAILILAAIGLAGMGLAVFGDVGVMVLCVLNTMRTLVHKA
jgi:Cd2+/Zn2+-exporting ATPase